MNKSSKDVQTPVKREHECLGPPKFGFKDGNLVLQVDEDTGYIQLTEATGTKEPDLMIRLVNQLLTSLPESSRENPEVLNASVAMMHGIAPQNELEGMLATQMTAVHNLAMNMTSRCMVNDQTFEGVNANINRITKLMRTFTNQMEALQKYRRKGEQKVTVQHVNVNEGGQAIVGDVNTKGRGGNG